MRPSLLLACLCLLATNLPRASAGFVTWATADGGNGHVYALVMPDSPAESLTWTQARDAAAAMTYQGSAGHLVTVTSAAEHIFLRQFADQLYDNFPVLATDRKYAWIGLYAPTPTSQFQWVTGEAVTFTAWAPPEPNFFGDPLWQYAHYWTRDYGDGPTWSWNNEKNDGFNPPYNTYGYIVEFDGPFQPVAVPGPATIVPALTGIVLMGGWLARCSRARPTR